MMPGRLSLAALVLAAVSIAWLDPHSTAREAARLYAAGKYEDAVAKYNQALTDQPDSALLHFNLGDAAYKQGTYSDALQAFQQVPTGDTDPARTARVAYNVGNTKYRLGEAAEASDPKAALGLYAEALVAYRRAMGAAPDDVDAKFNHEFVEKKIADLEKKLEEQQKEQEKKDEQQQQQDQQPQEQQTHEQQPKEQQDAQDQQGKDQQPQPPDQQPEQQEQAGQPAGQAETQQGSPGEMTKEEAAALLDSQRDQEVQPDEVTKRLQGAVVGEPAQDW